MPLFKGKGCKSTPGKAIAYITDKNKAEIVSSQNLDDNQDYALAIAGEVLRQNYDVIYVSCPDFFGKLEALHFGSDPNGEEEALFQTASNADLLILDDLGTEFNSSFFLTNLYSLLNNRLGAKLPTIVTTNVTDGALLEKLYTEKISSRLAGFVQIKFFGNDIRVQKANE